MGGWCSQDIPLVISTIVINTADSSFFPPTYCSWSENYSVDLIRAVDLGLLHDLILGSTAFGRCSSWSLSSTAQRSWITNCICTPYRWDQKSLSSPFLFVYLSFTRASDMFHVLYVVIYSISINNLDCFMLIIYDDVTDSIMDLFNFFFW
jgi:hypothetical protein